MSHLTLILFLPGSWLVKAFVKLVFKSRSFLRSAVVSTLRHELGLSLSHTLLPYYGMYQLNFLVRLWLVTVTATTDLSYSWILESGRGQGRPEVCLGVYCYGQDWERDMMSDTLPPTWSNLFHFVIISDTLSYRSFFVNNLFIPLISWPSCLPVLCVPLAFQYLLCLFWHHSSGGVGAST